MLVNALPYTRLAELVFLPLDSGESCDKAHPSGPVAEGHMRFLCDDPAGLPSAAEGWRSMYTFHSPNARATFLR